jgi:hypothetical protein
MTRSIWLASYPKSGNTWFRILLANLAATEPVGINDLPAESGIASAREPFDRLLMIDSGLLTHDEVDCLRPRLYEELAQGAAMDDLTTPEQTPPVRFVKVHDAYVETPRAEPLLAGRRGADGAIIIVRDPRDIAHSFAEHLAVDIDDAIASMNSHHTALAARPGMLHHQLRHRLLSWSEHVASWLDQADLPVHLVRYEDLKADTAGRLTGAMAFAGCAVTDAEVRRAVRFADFGRLRQQEAEQGFREASRRSKRPFFRLGETGAWRRVLTSSQVARIEAAHAPMMRRLGYELVTETMLAHTG